MKIRNKKELKRKKGREQLYAIICICKKRMRDIRVRIQTANKIGNYEMMRLD